MLKLTHELSVLREEAISGMNSLCARSLGYIEDTLSAEIGFLGLRLSNKVSFVHHLNVLSVAVGF
jgi:hypothetical protein